MCFVTYNRTQCFLRPTKHTNVVIAAYVTAHARLVLYSYLERLGERTLYCDTDSVIYKQTPGLYVRYYYKLSNI